MECNIQDQLIRGVEFGTIICNVSEDTLLSEVAIQTVVLGVYYLNGVLTVINIPYQDDGAEIYLDENKILKLRKK
jgi:hypothetical protein